MLMPFGKYKGHHVEDVPSDYLDWVLNECDRINPWLRDRIKAELSRRRGRRRYHEDDPPRHEAHPPPADVRQVLKTWFAQMSLRWHPDRGGSDQAMAAVKDGYERLRRLLEVT